MGRLRMPAKEFYSLTLSEFFDAVDGHREFIENERDIYLWSFRRGVYDICLTLGAKSLKEEEIFSLGIDKKLRDDRYKNMPKVTVKKQDE